MGRFFVHKAITTFGDALVKQHGFSTEQAFLFPSNAVARRCVEFLKTQVHTLVPGKDLRIVDLSPNMSAQGGRTKGSETTLRPVISAVFLPQKHYQVAKTFWQHSGDGISSRRAEFCHKALGDGFLSATVDESVESAPISSLMVGKGPRRYQKGGSSNSSCRSPQSRDNDHPTLERRASAEGKEYAQFVEERFGRNLDMSLAANAKLAIRRRIAGALTADVELHEALQITESTSSIRHVQGSSEDDVYLYSTGMSAIFNTHRTLMAVRGDLKSVCFGLVIGINLREA